MTSLLQRRGSPPLLWLTATIILCVGFGIGAGRDPAYALVALIGVAFVVAVIADLALGVGVFAALSFLDQLSGGSALSVDKLLGLLLFVSWALRRSTASRADARTVISHHPRIFAWIVVFLVWSVASAAWAFDSGAALTYVYRDILLWLLIPVVFSAVDRPRDVYVIVGGFLVGAVVSAIYGLLHPVAATAAAAGRLVGTVGDPNETAAVLVAAIALCFGLFAVARHSPRLKLFLALTIILSLVGTVQTLSRSGLIALAIMLAAGVVFGGPWRRAALGLLLAGVVGVGGYFLFFAPPTSVNRVTSSNSTGRSDIWKVGWRMFEANPVLGVGAGNFQYASVHYLQRPGLIRSAGFFIVTPKVAHNIYLEELATLGLPGLIMMLAIIFGGIGVALRAAHIFERIGEGQLGLLARSMILALFAFLGSDIFISGLQIKQLWIVFGLCLAMNKLARTQAEQVAFDHS